MYNHFIQKVVPFVLTFALSLLITTLVKSYFRQEVSVTEAEQQTLHVHGDSDACGGRERISFDAKPEARTSRGATEALKVTFQPKAIYTDEARANNVQGAVRLKVTLLASGNVGSIATVTRLPDGLTEQAIAAARQIRFEPKRINGIPVSVTVTREYVFTIY